MREKRIRLSVRIAATAFLLFCIVPFLSGTIGSAEELNAAFECQKAEELLKEGKFKVSGSEVKLEIDENSGGVIVSGDAAAYSSARFQFGENYDFGSETADYLLIDALAERRKNVELAFFLDDAKEPFVSVPLARQKKKDSWSTVKNRCINLSKEKITGKHTLSFQVVTKEQGLLKLAVRSVTFMKSDIPMVEFNLDETQGSIIEMNGDSQHDTECYGDVTINVPEGYQSEYTKEKCQSATYPLDYIRGRGNSTWSAQKKPYKFKLEAKQDLLGMGANKHWVLLANYYDVSMLRNKMTYWLGDAIGMEFTPQCEFVNVVMNQEYLGSYYLCEQVRVGKSRVNIDDLEKDEATKNAVDEKTISGGYLLSMFPYGDENEQVIETDHGGRYLIESPSFDGYMNETQLNYITTYMQSTENAIYGSGFKDENGISYKDYMDIDAAVDYYWIQEISKNGDAFGSTSTYLYKKRDGKLYWGPLWDFDFVAWGATEYSQNQCEGFTQNRNTWFRRLFNDPEFYQKVVERWPAIKEQLLEACRDGGQIDKYSQKQYNSQKYNYGIWGKYSDRGDDWWWVNALEEQNDREITYDSEVERLKQWVAERVKWIDEHLEDLKTTFYTITFQIDGTDFTTAEIEKGELPGDNGILPVPPRKDGYVFQGWVITGEDGKEVQLQANTVITKDVTATAKYVKRSEVAEVQKIAFAQQDVYMTRYDEKSFQYCVVPFDAYSGDLTWKSSDETIAVVDGSGTILIAKEKMGEAVITATAENGVTASFTVHVVDYSEYVSLKSIEINPKEITVKEGEYAQAQIVYTPENAITYRSIAFASSDESIVKVNDCGYLYGVSEGTALVVTYDYEFGVKTCKVTVTGKASKDLKKGSTFTADGLKYKVTAAGKEKEVQCTGTANKKMKKLVVPDTVTYQNVKYNVTAVGGFKNCKKLTTVTLGKNITSIDKNAFYGCAKLKKLTIQSKKLEKVGKNAIKGTYKKMVLVTPKGKKKQYSKMFEIS